MKTMISILVVAMTMLVGFQGEAKAKKAGKAAHACKAENPGMSGAELKACIKAKKAKK